MIDVQWTLRLKVVGIGLQPILSSTAECALCCESFGSYLLMNTFCICLMVAASHESVLVT